MGSKYTKLYILQEETWINIRENSDGEQERFDRHVYSNAAEVRWVNSWYIKYYREIFMM